tara:strand:- start:40198 stop:40569 length:372 start_codon:yes stop_codon:yes gene_type:complete
MEEICGLTFDWDDISLTDDKVQAELEWLCIEFGEEWVWVRESSSKTGLHVMIAELQLNPQTKEFQLIPLPMSVDKQMQYREKTEIECRGRFFSDLFRKEMGLRTSRIFSVKNGLDVGKWKRFK